MSHVMSWCIEGRHDKCHRKYQRFFIDPKSNKVVWMDEWRICQCKKRGCDCYIPPAERTKTTKRKPRKRKS